MTGQITVLPQDAVYRMDFSGVKILTYKVNGGAFFEYANSAFSGKVWGSMSMFGGAVSLNVPKGLDTDPGTVGLYFGPGNWEIYCGRQQSPIKVHFLITDVNGYMHLGQNVGLRVGGGLKAGSGKICLGIAAAEAYLKPWSESASARRPISRPTSRPGRALRPGCRPAAARNSRSTAPSISMSRPCPCI
jgi:hypothetical protein